MFVKIPVIEYRGTAPIVEDVVINTDYIQSIEPCRTGSGTEDYVIWMYNGAPSCHHITSIVYDKLNHLVGTNKSIYMSE